MSSVLDTILEAPETVPTKKGKIKAKAQPPPPKGFGPAPPTRPIKVINPPNTKSIVPTYTSINPYNQGLGTLMIPHNPRAHTASCPLATRPDTQAYNYGQHSRPSTTFYIGPIPPVFKLYELLQAVWSLSPRNAMFDLKSGVIQVEIPFDMNWQQVGECECFAKTVQRDER